MSVSLAQRDADAQHRTVAFEGDSGCDQHRTVDHAAAVANLFVAGIELDKRRMTHRPVAPLLKLIVQQPGGPADLGAGDLQPAELLLNFVDLTGGDHVDVHLGHGQLQRPFAAKSLLKGAWIKLQRAADLWHL